MKVAPTLLGPLVTGRVEATFILPEDGNTSSFRKTGR
jgi:hypothetical protein